MCELETPYLVFEDARNMTDTTEREAFALPLMYQHWQRIARALLPQAG